MIRWYWAPEGAQYLPHPSSITMTIWDDVKDRIERPIGELPAAPRVWRDGSMKPRPRGRDFHGQPDWYRTGVPAEATSPRFPQGPLQECFTTIATEACHTVRLPQFMTATKGMFATGDAQQLPEVIDLMYDHDTPDPTWRADLGPLTFNDPGGPVTQPAWIEWTSPLVTGPGCEKWQLRLFSRSINFTVIPRSRWDIPTVCSCSQRTWNYDLKLLNADESAEIGQTGYTVEPTVF